MKSAGKQARKGRNTCDGDIRKNIIRKNEKGKQFRDNLIKKYFHSAKDSVCDDGGKRKTDEKE